MVAAVNGSTIAGIEIETAARNEINVLVREKVSQWRETPLVVETDYGKTVLDTELFEFDIENAINEYMHETKIPWYLFWKSPDRVDIQMPVYINQQVSDELKKDPSIKIQDTLEVIEKEIGLQLSNVIVAVQLEGDILEDDRIALTTHEFNQQKLALNVFVDQLTGLSIMPGERISILSLVETGGMDQESLDFIASTIYSLLIQTNYEIIERHPSAVPLKTFTPGTEAHINKKQSKDLVFMNPNVVMGTLKFSFKDDNLIAELYSMPLDVKVEFFQSDKHEVQPRTIIRYSKDLEPGDEVEEEIGETGLVVTSYRKVSSMNGEYEKDEYLSKDFYPPVHRVILKPIVQQDVGGDNEIDTDSTLDPNLPNADNGQTDGDSTNQNGAGEGQNPSVNEGTGNNNKPDNGTKPSKGQQSGDDSEVDTSANDDSGVTVIYDKSGMPINSSGK